MTKTFYFYDLETSGFHPAKDRIMQFAGQRTTLDLKPIGQPDNILIKLSPDILPSPDAVLVHGITPQKTLADGISEVEFINLFQSQISTPGTIFTGFNSVRFDDEFMRFLHYRNLYDPYTWQWENQRSRWDLLDVVRMTRALRPRGIKWPFDSEGKPANKLELLTSANGIEHSQAHDALADVWATIEVAKLIRTKQPKLFEFLLEYRDKRLVKQLVLAERPFVYSSGKYDSDYEKTTVAKTVVEHPDGRGALVFDLRIDPSTYVDMNPKQLLEAWQLERDNPKRLPVKTLKYNRCPTVAPLSVLDNDSQKRLNLNIAEADERGKILSTATKFIESLINAVSLLEEQRQSQTQLLDDDKEAEERLYDGFFGTQDKQQMSKVHTLDPNALQTDKLKFRDSRLSALLPLYKACNFPKHLNKEELEIWHKHVHDRLGLDRQDGQLARYIQRVQELKLTAKTTNQQYLLEELELFGLSLLPSESFGG